MTIKWFQDKDIYDNKYCKTNNDANFLIYQLLKEKTLFTQNNSS